MIANIVSLRFNRKKLNVFGAFQFQLNNICYQRILVHEITSKTISEAQQTFTNSTTPKLTEPIFFLFKKVLQNHSKIGYRLRLYTLLRKPKRASSAAYTTSDVFIDHYIKPSAFYNSSTQRERASLDKSPKRESILLSKKNAAGTARAENESARAADENENLFPRS